MWKYKAVFPVIVGENMVEKNEYPDSVSMCDVFYVLPSNPAGQVMEVLEHLLHAITDVGLHYQYPAQWGISTTSTLHTEMQKAIAQGVYDVSDYASMKSDTEAYTRVLLQEFAYFGTLPWPWPALLHLAACLPVGQSLSRTCVPTWGVLFHLPLSATHACPPTLVHPRTAVITSAWDVQTAHGPNSKEWTARTPAELKAKLPGAWQLYTSTVAKIMAAPSDATIKSLRNLDAFGACPASRTGGGETTLASSSSTAPAPASSASDFHVPPVVAAGVKGTSDGDTNTTAPGAAGGSATTAATSSGSTGGGNSTAGGMVPGPGTGTGTGTGHSGGSDTKAPATTAATIIITTTTNDAGDNGVSGTAVATAGCVTAMLVAAASALGCLP